MAHNGAYRIENGVALIELRLTRIAQLFNSLDPISGWVAMWRPIQVFLYDWWPIRRNVRVFQSLAQADVELRAEPGG